LYGMAVWTSVKRWVWGRLSGGKARKGASALGCVCVKKAGRHLESGSQRYEIEINDFDLGKI